MATIPAPDVEQRLLQACRTIRALPDPDRRFFRMHTGWPEVVQEVAEAYGYTDASVPRFKPSPKDVGDFLLALSWARPLHKREFRFVWWRSFELSFKQMADRIHRSDETARRYYRDAILKCWQEANNLSTGHNVASVADVASINGQ